MKRSSKRENGVMESRHEICMCIPSHMITVDVHHGWDRTEPNPLKRESVKRVIITNGEMMGSVFFFHN